MSENCNNINETDTVILKSFNIKNGELNFKFMVESHEEKIKLIIIEQTNKNELIQIYEKILDLNFVKSLHKEFSNFTSCQELLTYLEKQIENKSFEISDKKIDSISIKLKKENIQIVLKTEGLYIKILARYFYEEIYDLKEDIITLKENKKIEEEINNLKLKIKEENEKIRNDFNLLKKENKQLKMEIQTKTKQLEDKLNKIMINKDNKVPQKISKIEAVNQLNNKKKPEIKKNRTKSDLNSREKKIDKQILKINDNKKQQKVEVNTKNNIIFD